jgi:hypothetical protein
LGIFNEKQIMGMPASKFFADIYTLSAGNHIDGMIPFFNQFMSNYSTFNTGSVSGNMVFARGSIDNIIEEIFKYYYYLFNQYVFSEVKKDNDINYKLFKNNFSIEVSNQLNSTNNYKDFLYENRGTDIEDLIDAYLDDIIEEDKSDPQFYKEILDYYDQDILEKKVLLKDPARILSHYISSSDLILNRPPEITVNENNILLFFSKVFFQLKCLPEDYECFGKTYHQENSSNFNEVLNLMIDNTYNSFTIQTAVRQAL